ncbi:hypothetical protein [Actinomadura verrucosospora]|uniref:Uncharacterized protein n=1 Tax=Actinomadura verrucosospora TaxID=46165 RepID=A0A7D4AU55_ACTVE|nr:hypothetical protein [Actinomadura verrucosospora]QKG25069.1 hypothetical protein ACTIVE_6720 [Actinomadura verrucosospora]
MTGRTRLSAGPGPIAWAAYLLLVLLCLPVLVLAFLLLVGVLTGGGGASLVGLVVAAAFCGVVVLLGARLYQRAWWLEGTVLVQRRVGRNRRCDLSTAWVSVESVSPSPLALTSALPRLVAWHDGEEPIRLWLRDPDRRRALLPALELAALAQAITYGREDDPRFHPIAGGLHALATDPFAV